MEEWRAVPGYEGYYEVSNEGQVRSLPRTVQQKHRKMRISARIMKQTLATDRKHVTVRLSKNDGGKTKLVHRIVAATFLGPCPNGMEVCHNNGNAKDNRLENLRYDTHANNSKDSVKHGAHFWASKPECDRGHPKYQFNVRLSKRKVGNNQCRSCQCANDYIRRKGLPRTEENLKNVSDLYYEKFKRQEGTSTQEVDTTPADEV